MKKKISFVSLLMLFLLIVSFILFRINSKICQSIGLLLFPVIIILGFLVLKKN